MFVNNGVKCTFVLSYALWRNSTMRLNRKQITIHFLSMTSLWRHLCQTGLSSDAQDWASELNPVWHRMLYSRTHMATVGVKGLILYDVRVFCWYFIHSFIHFDRQPAAYVSQLAIPGRSVVCNVYSVTYRVFVTLSDLQRSFQQLKAALKCSAIVSIRLNASAEAQ